MTNEIEEFECIVSAPVNIALVKYWGKRDESLILPFNDSISLSLNEEHLGTVTTVRFSTAYDNDSISLNGKDISITERLQNVLDEMRRMARKNAIKKKLNASELMKKSRFRFRIETCNNMPTAAGLASSASGLASVTFGLAVALGIERDVELSSIARVGSGSACRSVFGGLVRWHAGVEESGIDSIAQQVMTHDQWPELRLLILVVSDTKKTVGSTAGQQRSLMTSKIMLERPKITKERIDEIIWAYKGKNFPALAEVTMRDSNQLHAICMDSYPMIHYLSDVSFKLIDFVTAFNELVGSTKLGYTFDAGPNCFLLMEEETISIVKYLIKSCFLNDEEIRFGSGVAECSEKLAAEYQPLLDQYKVCKGSVQYAFQTHVGSGPKIIQPVTKYEP